MITQRMRLYKVGSRDPSAAWALYLPGAPHRGTQVLLYGIIQGCLLANALSAFLAEDASILRVSKTLRIKVYISAS